MTKDSLGDRMKSYYEGISKTSLMRRTPVIIRIDGRAFHTFTWRQQDATRNSIEMLGRYHFGDKKLFKKNCNDIQDMLMTEKEVNWNDIPTKFKRGIAVIQIPRTLENGEIRKEWIIDDNMPILTQDRDYVESRILI